MAWEDCVANIQRSYAPKQARDASLVNWQRDVTQDTLDNDTFKDGNPFILICPDRHCTDNVSTSPADHALCHCRDINNQPIPGCSVPSALYPEKASICLNVTSNPLQFNFKSSRACTKQGDSWYQLTCYCCCSCFANGTKIGIPNNEFRSIEDFVVGDKVLTAAVVGQPSAGNINLNWSTAKVGFSSGTGPDGNQSAMVFIHHGEVGSLIVTPDHLLMMSTGKLNRADRIVPGKDFLVSAAGQPVAINEVHIGQYHGGVHHITTDVDYTGSIDGHLLVSEGIVSGDFNLQIRSEELIKSGAMVDYKDLPAIGSDEYAAAQPQLATDEYKAKWTQAATVSAVAAAPLLAANPNVRKFFAFGQKVANVPDTAATYLSPKQEADVAAKADKLDFAEVPVGTAIVQYALKLFGGFYPDITFYYDSGELEPNAYAFAEYGRQFIVVSSGLTRIKGLGLEGLMVIMAHMVARLHKSAPVDANGHTTVGMADYYSSGILRTLFFGTTYSDMFGAGLKQVTKTVFAAISKDNHAYETDPFQPTIDTRIDALSAGDSMNFPPDGIGGPVQGGLKVTGATARPAAVTVLSLVGEDIDETAAAKVYADLQKNNVIDKQGVIASIFTMGSDLSFLFADQPADRKQYLTEVVRGALIHALATIVVTFNSPVDPRSAGDKGDYQLDPAATVASAAVAPDGLSATISANLQAGITYTLTVRAVVRGANGSTLSMDDNTASVSLG